jgi:hypothetical protein
VSVTQPTDAVKRRNGKTDRGTTTCVFELVFALSYLLGWWLFGVHSFIHSFQRSKHLYQRINNKSRQRSKISIVYPRTIAATSSQSTAVQPHILPGRISNHNPTTTQVTLEAVTPLLCRHISHPAKSQQSCTRTSGAMSQAVIQTNTPVPKYLLIFIINLSKNWPGVLLKKQYQPNHTASSLQRKRCFHSQLSSTMVYL